MNIEDIREYCISRPGVTEEFPFDDTTLVFKVMGRIFLLLPLEELPCRFNVKCDPHSALEWRERYESVQPGFHMNKKHWNTVTCNGDVPEELLRTFIDQSYHLVIKNLKRADRDQLNAL